MLVRRGLRSAQEVQVHDLVEREHGFVQPHVDAVVHANRPPSHSVAAWPSLGVYIGHGRLCVHLPQVRGTHAARESIREVDQKGA